MIKFVDFFKVPYPEKTKIKFNVRHPQNTETAALDLLYADEVGWMEMNSWKNKTNSFGDAEYVLTFAQYYFYGSEFYLFDGLYEIEQKTPKINDGVGYKLVLKDDFLEYSKRVIVRLEKPIGIEVYNRIYNNVQKQLNPEVYEILPPNKIGPFPGYGNVSIDHKTLQRIAKNDDPEWKKALSCVKGVYCITDLGTGKLYIGSASGKDEGIWQRWKSYADVNDLTGGNKTFNELKDKGDGYIINNFKYSIIEVFDMNTGRETIVRREEYWKKVFQTVKFGMNN